jgi:hypothetical protein
MNAQIPDTMLVGVGIIFTSTLLLILLVILWRQSVLQRRKSKQSTADILEAPEPVVLPGLILPSRDPWLQQIYPNGREVFFPPPPHANAAYHVVIGGVEPQSSNARVSVG